MRQLEIDVEAGTVRLFARRKFRRNYRKQWLEFYALLAIRLCRPAPGIRLVLPEEVKSLATWRVKDTRSVGKEVARHLGDLEAHGLRHWIAWEGKTKGWQLNLSPHEVRFLPSMRHVASWLNERYSTATETVPIEWIEEIVESISCLQEGETRAAHERAGAAMHIAKLNSAPLLAGAARIWASRAILRHGAESIPGADDDHFRMMPVSLHGMLGVSLRSRLDCIDSMAARFDATPGAVHSLQRIASRLEGTGDVAGLAQVYNVLGVLNRRLERYAEGVAFLKRSISLSLFTGDLLTLQSALFNAGHCQLMLARQKSMGRLRTNDAEVAEGERLLKLDRNMRQRFNLGQDSAQTELLLARLALHRRRIGDAEKYLGEAERILQKLRNEFEHGSFHRLRAMLEVSRLRTGRVPEARQEEHRRQVMHDLRIAMRKFEEAGDKDAAAAVKDGVEKLTYGGDIDFD